MADDELPIRAPRPLAVTPDLYPDEWLQTAVSRWAYAIFGCTRQDLFLYLRMNRYPAAVVTGLGVRPGDDVLTTMSLGTGLPVQALQSATLDGLDGKAIRFAAQSDHVLTNAGWVRRTGTRYCAACLRERPGVYLRTWRLAWSFVCTRHGHVLEDVCPGCDKPPTDVTGSTREMWNTVTCRNRLDRPGGYRICGTDLTDDHDVIALEPDSPVIAAQRFIDRSIADDPDAIGVLRTLVGIVSALRAIGDVQSVCDLAGVDKDGLLGLIEPEERVGASAPKDAYALAVLTAAAVRLMTEPETLVGPAIRDITFSRTPGFVPRGAGMSVGSVRELLTLWGHPDAHMQGRILRALDMDLPVPARVRYATALPPKVRPTLNTTLGTAPVTGESVPRLLWPEWAIPLHVGDGSTLDATRHAFMMAVADEERSEIRPTMLGDDTTTNRIISSLGLLGVDLRAAPIPINYGRRRRLVRWPRLLKEEQWQRVCEAAGYDPGARRRWLLARRYLYLRATGDRHSDLPPSLMKQAKDHDVADLTAFILSMTAELQTVLDGYLRAFLNAFDNPIAVTMFHRLMPVPTPFREEPLVWLPPRGAEYRAWAVGPEFDDIDADRLHDMVRHGEKRLGVLAAAVERSTPHVRAYVEMYPAPSGREPSVVDWSSDFADGLPTFGSSSVDEEEDPAPVLRNRSPKPSTEPTVFRLEHADRYRRVVHRARLGE